MKNKHIAHTLLALSLAMMLASCASRGIRGQAPFVQINSLRLQEDLLSVDLGVRNVNTEALYLEQIEFAISLDETSLAIYKAASQASISANGTENFRFVLSPSPKGIELLNSLQSGDIPSLEYSLEGMMLVQEEAELKVRHKGRIFPVPGRSGHFR